MNQMIMLISMKQNEGWLAPRRIGAITTLPAPLFYLSL